MQILYYISSMAQSSHKKMIFRKLLPQLPANCVEVSIRIFPANKALKFQLKREKINTAKVS